ncbi:MAG: DUF2061 domain-containing protein [Halorientalis sp.]
MAGKPGLIGRTPHKPRRRALAKAAGYRVLMVFVTVAVAFALVGDATQALSIGIVANAIKTGTYYAYERLWDRIAWGL